MALPKSIAPMDVNYHPELDNTNPLNEEDVSEYQAMIGILRWNVETGRMDIINSVSLMSSYLCNPTEGHFMAVLKIYGYLKDNASHTLIFDPGYPSLQRSTSINKEDWIDFYHNAKEVRPPNAPEPRGHPVTTYGYVDADHARNLATRRSHSGIILFVNSSPFLWFGKKQGNIETSTYGAELLATRIAIELAEGLRYKLRMFGVPVDGPTLIYCDNQSVVHGAQNPTSTLKKKHFSISFHKVRECVAASIVENHKVNTKDNLADLLTQPLSGIRTQALSDKIFFKVQSK